ncbi:MAG: hypothetical protein LBF09_05950 [Odoribacteraceae bacterium]|jgi:hypothetical protein|nr:hypothetical protein [Odoribacteraceae bacterium]
MIQAICYKEWIKTRGAVLLSGVLLAAYAVYAFIHTGQLFRVDGAVATWSGVILKDAFLLPGATRWLPLATGLMVGLAQFVPELTERRLKLTLHLPLPAGRVLSVMLLHGVITLLALYLPVAIALLSGLSAYYPPEITGALAWRALPWFAAGIAAYLFTAWTCVEPSWQQRVKNVLVAAGALPACYVDGPAGSYLPFLPWLVVILAVAFLAPFQAAGRFKEGVQ